MSSRQCVLLAGGTGRTGGRVLAQLLDRGIEVRAIVRSAERLPAGVAGNPLLTVIEGDLLAMPREVLDRHLDGCDTVISCLGHTISLKGVFGPPHGLVVGAVAKLCRGIEARRPATPVKFILMSSVSVNRPANDHTRRGAVERAFLWVVCGLVPPAKDNQRAADLFAREIGPDNRAIEWVVVRPDTLIEGDVSEYSLSEELVSSLFKPDKTTMASVAHFMCELATDANAWQRWKGKMPVIVNGTRGT